MSVESMLESDSKRFWNDRNCHGRLSYPIKTKGKSRWMTKRFVMEMIKAGLVQACTSVTLSWLKYVFASLQFIRLLPWVYDLSVYLTEKTKVIFFKNALISYPNRDNHVHLGTNDCQRCSHIFYERFLHSSSWWHWYHWLIDTLAIEKVYLIRLSTSCLQL